MYLYKIPSNKEDQPEWFRERLRKIRTIDRLWVWNWNAEYDRKIVIRGGSANLIFEDEADFIWFSLSEL